MDDERREPLSTDEQNLITNNIILLELPQLDNAHLNLVRAAAKLLIETDPDPG